MVRSIGISEDTEAVDKNLSIDQINSLIHELKDAKNQMKQFQLELKIKEQENVILNQQIKHVQLKSCIIDANQKKEQLITRTVSNMENEETAEDSM